MSCCVIGSSSEDSSVISSFCVSCYPQQASNVISSFCVSCCPCNTQSTLSVQLVYNLNTYDHAMCMRFHQPLHMTLSTCLQLVVPLSCYYISTTFSLFCNYYSTILLLIFHYIATHNIMLPYKLSC